MTTTVQKKTYVFDNEMTKLLATCWPLSMQEKEKGERNYDFTRKRERVAF
jgi:hypothetical protein